MTALVILKTGDKLASLADHPGDYEDWIAAGMGLPASAVRVCDIARGEPLPPVDARVGAAAVTGSGAMVSDRAAWTRAGEAWLREAVAARVPLLGICFGHQMLAQALGGRADYNPRGTEVGTVELHTTDAAADDPLFGPLPTRFPAQVTHRQCTLALPPGAVLLAASERDPHQAFRYGPNAWGVQFHPEFDAAIIRHYVGAHHAQLLAEGQDPEAIRAGCRPTPESGALLRRFAALAGLPGST